MGKLAIKLWNYVLKGRKIEQSCVSDRLSVSADISDPLSIRLLEYRLNSISVHHYLIHAPCTLSHYSHTSSHSCMSPSSVQLPPSPHTFTTPPFPHISTTYFPSCTTPPSQMPLLVPSLSYNFETMVECLDDMGRTEPISVFVLRKGNPVPIITAIINMPVSESVIVV